MTFTSPGLIATLAVMVRTGSLLSTAPLLDTLALGPRLKAALALVIALLVAPAVAIPGASGPLDPFGLGALLLGEAAVGAAIGLTARLLLTAMELAGTLLGYQTGFWVPTTVDPTSALGPNVLSALWGTAAALIFLSLDAHHLLLRALVSSYELGSRPGAGLAEAMLSLSARIFPLALTIAAPLLLTLWLTDLTLGVAGRSVRELDVLFVSYPLKTALTLLGLGVTARLTLGAFARLLEGLEGDLGLLLGA